MPSISNINKKITSKGNALETSLTKKLRAFYNKNIAPFAGIFPSEVLRQKYDETVRNIIRKAVQDSYLFGTSIVGEQMTAQDPDFELFISGQDINNIQGLTDRLNEDFWQISSRLMNRESEFVQLGDVVKKKPELDVNAAITGITASIIYASMNMAVKSKMPIVTAARVRATASPVSPFIPPPLPPNVSLAPSGEPTFDITLDIPFEISRLGDEGTENKIMFLTKEDAKVDPEICAPLNRNVYAVDDPEIPELPMHPHCRCRLVPVVV